MYIIKLRQYLLINIIISNTNIYDYKLHQNVPLINNICNFF